LSDPWGCTLGQPARQASALVREGGTCHLVKAKTKKERKPVTEQERHNEIPKHLASPAGVQTSNDRLACKQLSILPDRMS